MKPVSNGAPRRVLWAIKGLGPGGAEQLLASGAAVADRDAFDHTVAYLLPWKDALVPRFEECGFDVVCLETRRSAGLAWARPLRRLLQERRFDIVHAHSPMVATVVRLVVRSLPPDERPAVVVTEHNLSSGYRAATRALNWATAPLDDARFAVSAEVRTSLPAFLQPTTETLIHGVALEDLRGHAGSRERVRAELGLSDDDRLVLTVANYRAQKDYPTLFAAARTVIDRAPQARFAAVGQGQLERDVHRWHAAYGFGDEFRLLGYRDDVPDLLAAADIFVLASTFEGLPVAIMEALALGVPVVATSVGGVPELVRDRQEGLLVPAGDPAALADALVHLVEHDDTRAAMAAAALERSAVVDIRGAVTRYEAEYRRLGGRAPAAPRRTVRRTALGGTKRIASLADLGPRRTDGLVVLAYHRVGANSGTEVDLPVGLFEEQMAFLATDMHVVSLDEGLARVLEEEAPEEPLVAITFDDGTADFVDGALPVLERYRLPVTLYVATEFVESRLEFPHHGVPVSWEGLRDARATNLVDIASHTHRHRLLDRLPDDEVADELDRSITLIQQRLGVDPRHFAYPKAIAGSRGADRAVRARFRSAALAGTRPNRYGHTDPFRLTRSPIQVSDGMRWFQHKARGGMWLEDSPRSLTQRWRYAGRTT